MNSIRSDTPNFCACFLVKFLFKGFVFMANYDLNAKLPNAANCIASGRRIPVSTTRLRISSSDAFGLARNMRTADSMAWRMVFAGCRSRPDGPSSLISREATAVVSSSSSGQGVTFNSEKLSADRIRAKVAG